MTFLLFFILGPSTIKTARNITYSKEIGKKARNLSYEMNDKYNEILVSFHSYLEESKVTLDKIKWLLKGYLKYPPIYDTDKEMDIGTVSNIMDILVSYSSFFNFKLLEKVIRAVKFKAGIHSMDEYKKDFDFYVKQITVFECPSNIGILSRDRISFFIKLDDGYRNCRQQYLISLKKDLCKILKVDEELLYIESVEEGCISVEFHLTQSCKKVFPISEKKIALIRSLRYNGAVIQRLLHEDKVYTVNVSEGNK